MKISTGALIAAVTLGGAIPISSSVSACASQGPDIGVVVRFTETEERHYCSTIEGDKATGIEALEGTGLKVITKDFGGSLGIAVCKIEDVGTDPSNCPSSSGFWHYWHLDEGTWLDSSVGAANYMIQSGAVEGWTWQHDNQAIPPSIAATQIECESVASGNRSRGRNFLTSFDPRSASALAGVAILLFLVSRALRRRPG